MSRAIKDVMRNSGGRSGLGMDDSSKRRGATHRLVTSSFSPMSNQSRSGRKASLGRSSIKKQNTTSHLHNDVGNNQNNGSLLNMSNEVALMRSLSPSIQQQDTRQHVSHHKRNNSSMSPYANINEAGQQSNKKSAYNSLTSNGILNYTQGNNQHESAFRKYQTQIRNS